MKETFVQAQPCDRVVFDLCEGLERILAGSMFDKLQFVDLIT